MEDVAKLKSFYSQGKSQGLWPPLKAMVLIVGRAWRWPPWDTEQSQQAELSQRTQGLLLTSSEERPRILLNNRASFCFVLLCFFSYFDWLEIRQEQAPTQLFTPQVPVVAESASGCIWGPRSQWWCPPWVPGTKAFAPHLLPARVYISRKLESGVRCSVKSKYSNVGIQSDVLTTGLNGCPAWI